MTNPLNATGPINPQFDFNHPNFARFSPEVTGRMLLKSMCLEEILQRQRRCRGGRRGESWALGTRNLSWTTPKSAKLPDKEPPA